MNFEKYKNKGLNGLANLGNTCFINSCMQIVSHTYELNQVLDKDLTKNKLKNIHDTELILEWDSLRKLTWSKTDVIISPEKFINTIHKVSHAKKMEIFNGYEQNDVAEFLVFLIDCFHNSLSREISISISGKPKNNTDLTALKCFEMIKNRYAKDYSEIWNLFYAVHVSEISRLDNNKVISSTPEPYFMIDLPIPPDNKSPTLYDCFDHYCKKENIEHFKDENAGEFVEVERKLMFWSFPSILTIDLKRFNAHNLQKNQVFVRFPVEELDLSNYVVGYKKSNYKYELYGVCNHSGGVHGGHYTSYVKNANGKWYHFNDTSVNEIKNVDEINSSKAYVLFYRKI